MTWQGQPALGHFKNTPPPPQGSGLAVNTVAR